MGEIYNLSEEELQEWRDKIKGALDEHISTSSVYLGYLVLIWVYEYLEAFAVNETGMQAKLGRVKELWAGTSNQLLILFRVRSMLVHRPYTINRTLINNLIPYAEMLDLVLRTAGFEFSVFSKLDLYNLSN